MAKNRSSVLLFTLMRLGLPGMLRHTPGEPVIGTKWIAFTQVTLHCCAPPVSGELGATDHGLVSGRGGTDGLLHQPKTACLAFRLPAIESAEGETCIHPGSRAGFRVPRHPGVYPAASDGPRDYEIPA